jgi:hypothetical protein
LRPKLRERKAADIVASRARRGVALVEDQDRPTFLTSDAVQRPVGVDGDRVTAGPKQRQIAGGVRIREGLLEVDVA